MTATRIALVTGATAGPGRAVADALAESSGCAVDRAGILA
jgi:NAD(P)-dependent dehydrogenase (short-subunit alcohol dehydrogenase family)